MREFLVVFLLLFVQEVFDIDWSKISQAKTNDMLPDMAFPGIAVTFRPAGLNVLGHMMVKQLSTIQAMVAQDPGVSLVPSLSIKDVQGVAAIPLKPRQFRSIGMIYGAASVANPALQTWMNLARDRLRRQASPLRKARRLRFPKQQTMDRLRSTPHALQPTTLHRGGKHSKPSH
jgi:hypothetical protein